MPRYQRGYSWGSEEVKELLKDLSEAHSSFPNEAYLLGQIIVCPSTQKLTSILSTISQMDLIDGQQRCTTLYLIILIASKILDENMPAESSAAARRKQSVREILKSIPDSRNDSDIYPRIRVASNGEDFVLKLLKNEELGEAHGPTQTNIQNAVDDISAHLETYSAAEVESLLDFVLDRVWLVRLSLESSAHALRVFQKVNNRGLELDDADLIKNFLFQQVSDDEYITLSNRWEDATNTLHGARLKRVRSMEFLMKLLIGIQTGNSVATPNLYNTWADLLTSEEKVQDLASKLPPSARNLVRISKSQIPNSGQATDISTGAYMQSWIQQFEVQLAAEHFSPQSYERLLKMVEDRTMLSYWSKEPSQAFERIIHPWAYQIAKLDSNPSFSELAAASRIATENFQDLAERAFLGIRKLSYLTVSHRDRIRYVLARINRRIQSELNSTPPTLRDLMQTSKGENVGYDLDHVFPKSPNQRNSWLQSTEKDLLLGSADRYEASIHSIGNLILLHPDDNRNQSDSLPWEEEKLRNLGGSELYANRLLVPSEFRSQNSRIEDYIDTTQGEYPARALDWSEDSIDERAEFYWQVLISELKENLFISD